MSHATTFLFTDIEGSTRLWEEQPERMQRALAAHDALCKALVAHHRGSIVKTTGDGLHAAFDDPADAVAAMLAMQRALADPTTTGGLELRLRAGAHLGPTEQRDADYYGPVVNRAARISGAAHGGQMLVSQAVADALAGRLEGGVGLRDLGSVRLRDLSSPEHIHQVLHPQLRADFPPLRSLEATPNNLSQQLNTFVDREHERAEIRSLLESHRLFTLLGVGGIGKSRLSIQLAAEVMDDYPDGVWLVELAPLSDPLLVPQAVASVLGVKEAAGQTVLEALLSHVRERRALILLDNCEHLLQACADIAKRLLQAGKYLRIIATSREHLRVAGERAYPLPALATPEQGDANPAGHGAVQLFVDRVAAVQPGFRVTEANTAAVVEICRRVDGIPLAIELAAARARALSVEAIAKRLLDSFRLLSTTDSTVLPRQRTLRALIDWSHDLLSDSERVLFRRLSVFAGGFTLEAAEQVSAGEGLDEVEIVDVLTQLVEKSLAAFDAQRGRYRLLETVRQYAQERLTEAAETAAVRERHLACFLALAEAARPQLAGPDQAAWLQVLDHERENLLTAHLRADTAAEGGGQGLRLSIALRPYWINRGLPELGLRLSLEALARSGAQPRSLERCKGLLQAGQLGIFMGRLGEARGWLEEGVSIARELGDIEWVAALLQPLGNACLDDGDAQTARGHLEEALVLARQLSDPREVAAAAIALAQLYRMGQQFDAAQALYDEAVAISRRTGDLEVEAIGLLNLAMVRVGRRDLHAAAGMLAEVVDIAVGTGSMLVVQSALEVAAGLAASADDVAAAAGFFGAAAALSQQTGLQRDAADEAFIAPLIAHARTLGERGAFDAAEALGRQRSRAEAMDLLRGYLLLTRGS